MAAAAGPSVVPLWSLGGPLSGPMATPQRPHGGVSACGGALYGDSIYIYIYIYNTTTGFEPGKKIAGGYHFLVYMQTVPKYSSL